MSKPVFIVEYTYTPDQDVNHICRDVFVDPMIARHYIRERAEDTLANYAEEGDTDFVMEVSWEVGEDWHDEVSLKRPDGRLIEHWLLKQLTLNEQTEV